MNTPQETRIQALLAYYLGRLDYFFRKQNAALSDHIKTRDSRALQKVRSHITELKTYERKKR